MLNTQWEVIVDMRSSKTIITGREFQNASSIGDYIFPKSTRHALWWNLLPKIVDINLNGNKTRVRRAKSKCQLQKCVELNSIVALI